MGQGEIRDEFQQPLVEGDRLIDLTGVMMPHRLGEEPARCLIGLAGHCGKSAQPSPFLPLEAPSALRRARFSV